MNDQTPHYPFLLDADPGTEERAIVAAGVGGVAVPAVPDLPGDAPIAYVAYERERVVAGWLWWSDQHGAVGHVPNAFDPVARGADGVTLVVDVPWAESLREALTAGTPPSRAVLAAMERWQTGDVALPAQSPFRAPSLEHLRVIAGVRDYEAARAAFAAARGVTPAAPPEAPAAPAAPDALAAATADAPELAAPGPATAAPAAAAPAAAAPAAAAPKRRGFWARLFGRRR